MTTFSNGRRFGVLVLSGLLLFAAGSLWAAGNSISYAYYNLSLLPGKDASELNATWLTDTSTVDQIQVAPAPAKSGEAFPVAKAKSFKAVAAKVTYTAFNAEDTSTAAGNFAHKVVLSGLLPDTSYVYRVGDGKSWGPVQVLATRNPKSFNFIAVGDPQLGSKATGPKTLENDTAGWADTLNKATTKFNNASFVLCLGDEVNDYNSLATQNAEYKAFFSPQQLTGLPLAPANGNHDFQLGEFYGYHYNFPNLSNSEGVAYGNDGDYWFTYGNALFMVLNSNTQSIATHDLFIQKAVAKNPKATWRIVALHHSVYSEADHFKDPDIIDRRTNYPPVFERYHIDVVFQGHDHAFTRTYQMLKGKPQKEQKTDEQGRVVDPSGIVYLTLNSGSGSKFYDWTDASPEVFSASRWQGKVPSFSNVKIDDKVFSVTTYRTDDQSQIDSYSIVKTK